MFNTLNRYLHCNIPHFVASENKPELLKIRMMLAERLANCNRYYPWPALAQSIVADLEKVDARLEQLTHLPTPKVYVKRRNKR